jgi:hypothetical protein
MLTMFIRLLLISLYFVISPISESYGVSLSGIKLSKLLEAASPECNLKPGEQYLHEQFGNLSFKKVSIDDAVQVDLLPQGNESLPPGLTTDTDDESSVQSNLVEGPAAKLLKDINKKGVAYEVKKSEQLNRSRHPGRATNAVPYSHQRNYLRTWPDSTSNTGEAVPHAPASVGKLDTKELCCQLTKDAFLISESGIADRPGSTTCLCVALRDKKGYIKKFIFHNGESLLGPNMRNKAHELGYDVIQTQQSHAEGQLIQFLLDRHQRRPGWYTHIMGMGCSRCHCVECNALLELFLGKDYDKFTASINTKKNTAEAENTADTSLDSINTRISDIQITKTDQDGFCLTKTIERSATMVFGLDAVGKGTFDKFYLPLVLRDAINEKLPQELDFHNELFIKSEE